MALLKIKFVSDTKNPAYEVVEFHGDLDKSTISNAENKILKFLETFDSKALIFDLGALNFINSEGVGFMVAIHSKLCKKQKLFVLCGLKPHISDVMIVIGLPKIIPIFEKLDGALAFVNKN